MELGGPARAGPPLPSSHGALTIARDGARSPMSPHAPRAVLRLLPDEPLARLAAGGSEPAFDVLYTRHAAGLTASCRRILRNDEDARDALQNTMLKAWAALDRRGDAPLRLWLHRIAHNESVSLLRRRRPSAELPASAAAITDVHAVAADRAELAAAIGDIGDLTPRQREALLMRTLGDSSYDDIAATLQTSPAAARQSVTSARRALRRRRLAGVLPVPAWIMELSSLASSGTSALSGQVAGRAAATLGAAVATIGVVHGPVTEPRPAASAHTATTTHVRASSAPSAARPAPVVTATRTPATTTTRPANTTDTKTSKAPRTTRTVPTPSRTSTGDGDDPWPRDDTAEPPLGDEPAAGEMRMLARRAPSPPEAPGDAQDPGGRAWTAPPDAVGQNRTAPAATPWPADADPDAGPGLSTPEEDELPAPPAP